MKINLIKKMSNRYLLNCVVLVVGTIIYIPLSAQSEPSDTQNVIAEEVLKFSISDFTGDPIVVQIIDPLNSNTKYQDTIENIILKSKFNDNGKEVVVYPVDKTKFNTFVVLRKALTQSLYYINYAYIREATAQDERTVLIGGTKKCIEWDTWENRKILENPEWLDCRATIIVSCAYNDSLVGSPMKNMFVKKPDSPNATLSLALPFSAEAGYSTNFNSEFFEDIDDLSKPKVAPIGRSLKLETDSVPEGPDLGEVSLAEETRLPPKATSQFYMLVDVVKAPGSSADPKTKSPGKEFIPCTNCTGDRYKKVCKGTECQMKLDKKVEDTPDANQIYVLKWAVVKTKSDSGSVKQDKIKHYMPTNIYWKDCTDDKNCIMVQTKAGDDLTNVKLYTVVRVEEPVESEDSFVMSSVDRFQQMASKDVVNLYKNRCSKITGKIVTIKCQMKRLVQRVDADDEITTSSGGSNGEYKLYTMALKTNVKKDSEGRKVKGKISKFEPAKTIADGEKVFTNICENDQCSLEPVSEQNEYTTYIIAKVNKNVKLPNGKDLFVSRFQAVPSNTVGNLFVKFCEPEKSCVMKPYEGQSSDYVKFFRAETANNISNEDSEKIFTPVKLLQTVCLNTKCHNETITNVEELFAGNAVYEKIPAHGEQKEEIVNLTATSYDDIFYEICGNMCAKIPVTHMAIQYFRLVQHKSTVTTLKTGRNQLTTSEFVPTKIFKQICKAENCSLEFIPEFNLTVQKEIVQLKLKLFYLTYTSLAALGDLGVKMARNFIELDEASQNALFEQDCDDIEKCPMKHVDNLVEHQVYRKVTAPNASQPSQSIISFQPIQLYRKTCSETSEHNCSMTPIVITSEDLKNQTILYVPRETAGKTDYVPLDPESVDQLYRKHCDTGKCSMKPLKEDEPNVYYELKPTSTGGREEFKIVLVYHHFCLMGHGCHMEAYIYEDGTHVPEHLYIRVVTLQESNGTATTVAKKFVPIKADRQDKIFRKICQGVGQKCFMKPLYEVGLLREVTETVNNAQIKKYIPAKIYRSFCDVAGNNCEMKLVLPTDPSAGDFDLFELENVTTISTKKISSTQNLTRNRRKFRTFPHALYNTLYKRVCLEDGCTLKRFFEDDGEIVIVDKVIKSTEAEPTAIEQDAKQTVTVVEIYQKICNHSAKPVKCRMIALMTYDNPRNIELFHSVDYNKTNKVGKIVESRKYESVLVETLPKLFWKTCQGTACKLTRLFPEDENTIYKKDETGNDLVMAFLRKKICSDPAKPKKCEMIAITTEDNPRKVHLFETFSDKTPATSPTGETTFRICKKYKPILPETHQGVYFRKVCNSELKTCVLKDLFDDKNTVFQQITIETPENPEDLQTEYRLLHLYKKNCKAANECEMEFTTPEDDFKNAHLFELTTSYQNKTNDEGHKIIEHGTYLKHFDPIPDDIKFTLYRKVCKNIDCVYTPLVESPDSIYKLVRTVKQNTTIFNKDTQSQQDQKISAYVLIQLYKKDCSNSSENCTMKLLNAKHMIPDTTFQLILTKGLVDAEDGSGKKEGVVKKFVQFTLRQYYKLYRKSCKGNGCQMVPIRENKFFRLVHQNTPTMSADGHWKVQDVKKFIPAKLFTKVCMKPSNETKVQCDMSQLCDTGKIQLEKLYELKENLTDSKKSVYFDPIDPVDVISLYKKNCTKDNTLMSINKNNASKCLMTPLIPQDVFIGKIFKVVKIDLSGVRKVDTELDLTPVHLYKKTCDPKKTEKNKCEMNLFTAADVPDAEGHYHLFNMTLEKKINQNKSGEPYVNTARKYFSLPPSVEDMVYRKVCENGNCFAKPVFDSTFYLWKNTTRTKKRPDGEEEDIFAEELIPVQLAMEICTAGQCSIQPLTGEEEDIKPPVKIFAQSRKSERKTLPNGRDVDETVLTNRNFTSEMRHRTSLKICPPDQACYMKPFDETKLGISLLKLEQQNPELTATDAPGTVATVPPPPAETVTEMIMSIPPETPISIPEVKEGTTEASFVEEVPTPLTELRAIPDVTQGPPETVFGELDTTFAPTEEPGIFTEIMPLPDSVTYSPEKIDQGSISVPPISVLINSATTAPETMTSENLPPILMETSEEPPSDLTTPQTPDLDKGEIKRLPDDGTILGELSDRVTAPPNDNVILMNTSGLAGEIKDGLSSDLGRLVEGEIDLPEIVQNATEKPVDNILIVTSAPPVFEPTVNAGAAATDAVFEEEPGGLMEFGTTPVYKEVVVDIVSFEKPSDAGTAVAAIDETSATVKASQDLLSTPEPASDSVTSVPDLLATPLTESRSRPDESTGQSPLEGIVYTTEQTEMTSESPDSVTQDIITPLTESPGDHFDPDDMTGLPDASDEYDDADDMASPTLDDSLMTKIKNVAYMCPLNVIFETADRKRLIFQLSSPIVENIVNKVTAFIFETIHGRVLTFSLPEVQDDSDGKTKWLQIVYSSPAPAKQKFIFELPGFASERVPLDGLNITLDTPQGIAIFKIPHPSVNDPMDVFFSIKHILVHRRLTNFKLLRQSTDLDIFNYNEPCQVIIEDVPDSDVKRYSILFKTPDEIFIEFKGKKNPGGPVVIRKILFETCRNKNVSTRLPLFEVHRKPLDPKWLDLFYTHKDAVQQIKFPGVNKDKNKYKKYGGRPNFKTPKGIIVFDLPKNDLENLFIFLLLNNGEKYRYELPGLTFNISKPEEDSGEVESRSRKNRPTVPLAFSPEDNKKVIFITNPPLNIQDPYDVYELDFEVGEDYRAYVPLPGEPILENQGETLVLIYKSPQSQETYFNFPMIQYNGEPELAIKTDSGKITLYLPQVPETSNPLLSITFNDKSSNVVNNFTLPGFRVKKSSLADHPDNPKEEPMLTEVSIETPDNLVVTFLTEDKDYKPIFRVFTIKLQVTPGILEYEVHFPAKTSPKNVKYLELEYSPPNQDKILFQIPGLLFDPETMKPGKTLEVDSAKGKLVFDFPRLDDRARDNIRILYTVKNNSKTYVYDTPFLNLPGIIKPKRFNRHKQGLSVYTVDGKLLTLQTETTNENSEEVLIIKGLNFEIDAGRNVTVKLEEKSGKKRKRNMELLYMYPGEQPVAVKLTGVPYIDPNFGASRFNIKSDLGTVVVDIPRPTDESRSGIQFDLLLINEEKIPYEINGLVLKGTEEMIKSTKSAQTLMKYSVKSQSVFTDTENKRIAFMTIVEPGAGTPYRILEGTFEIPGQSNTKVTMAQPTIAGVPHTKWVQLMFTSGDGTDLYFEIPGIPNVSADESEWNTRKFKFEPTSSEDTISMTVPGPYSAKEDFEGLEFNLVTKTGKKYKYELKGFVFDSTIMKSSPGESVGRSFGSSQATSVMGRPEGVTQNLFHFPGWKIQYQNITPNVTLEHEEDIFYGLGNCPYKRITLEDLNTISTKEAIVDFYLTVLRTECLADKQSYIHSLIKEGHLEISGRFLRVPQKALFVSKPKLNYAQAQKLSSSFELEIVTRIFMDEITLPNTSPTNPNGSRISRSVNFLTNLALNYISKSRTNCRLHFIRLSRHLLTTLKIGSMKLVQDKVALDECKDCLADKKINYNDRLQVMGLMQFIIHGMAPVELGTIEVSAAFQHFFLINLEALKSRLR